MADPKLTYYGKPCKYGHDGLRYKADSCCVQCNRLKARRRHLKQKPDMKSRQDYLAALASKSQNHSRHPLYHRWSGMKSRCYNPNSAKYHAYGARGITVCDRWKTSFATFLADIMASIGPCPGPRYSLDRIDNDGNYEPGNIRWATDIKQIHNSRATKLTPEDIETIRRLYKPGRNGRNRSAVSSIGLAKRFGVTSTQILNVVNPPKYRLPKLTIDTVRARQLSIEVSIRPELRRIVVPAPPQIRPVTTYPPTTFQGNPCRRGHAGLRWLANGECVECSRLRQRGGQPKQIFAERHGHCRNGQYHPLYKIWTSMKQRCFNPNRDSYPDYGGRGITVCDRWASSFSAFLTDILAEIGQRPSRHHSLHRINNDGNYESGNVIWATDDEQHQNTRRTRLTWTSVRIIRELTKRHGDNAVLARAFNVSPNTIWAIANGDSWKE